MIDDMKVKDLLVLMNLLNPIKDEFKKEDERYVLIRTYSAGVHAGYLESKKGKEVVLKNSRRLWKWAGANTLSDIAMDGVNNPNECKFSQPVDRIELTEAIEIINVTEKAKKIIIETPIWK